MSRDLGRDILASENFMQENFGLSLRGGGLGGRLGGGGHFFILLFGSGAGKREEASKQGARAQGGRVGLLKIESETARRP